LSGRAFEAVAARRAHRPARDVLHAALEVERVAGARESAVTIEMTPAWGMPAGDRGVVGQGAVGASVLGRSRFFRYELRCWEGGTIPDRADAIAERRVEVDRAAADALLALVPRVPRLVWGRDPLGAGDMWTSNSVVAWLLARGGLLDALGGVPPGGRAPGWDAGVLAAGVRSASR